MNQIGSIFREARTNTGKTIEEAVKETKIARKYLNALENEDFDVFPGETYLIGFMRNYAQFLGLDPDEMVHKYRDYKIQEQPAPIEQLTAKPRNVKRYVLLVVLALLIVASVLYIYIATSGRKEKKGIPQESISKVGERREEKSESKQNVIVFEEEELTRDFKKGDIIEIAEGSVPYRIHIDSISENLNFSIGEIPFTLSTSERVEVDFNRDGRKDVILRTNRLGEGSVNLTIKRSYGTEIGKSGTTAARESADQVGKTPSGKRQETSGPPEVVVIKEDDMLAKLPIAPKSGFQIVSSYEKTEINSFLKAVGTSYFGYIVDEEEKKEALLRNGDVLSLSAKDILRVMVANPGAVEFRVNEISISLGKKGEVIAKIVRWYRDADNKDLYHLVIDDWEK